MSSNRRRAEIERVAEEGRQAAFQGKHFETNPYHCMNSMHWAEGYMRGQEELDLREDDSEEHF